MDQLSPLLWFDKTSRACILLTTCDETLFWVIHDIRRQYRKPGANETICATDVDAISSGLY